MDRSKRRLVITWYDIISRVRINTLCGVDQGDQGSGEGGIDCLC
jgi:hypothetical protein